ncbi:MAG: DUF4258 domain-containing protein [Bacteroidetes bacterium]|nr:DUF4258 domain-containing protein [Bacteroidota bacterium]MCL5738473.1 DUF4258 domain-containing protein [Bacteroidota bacterium]
MKKVEIIPVAQRKAEKRGIKVEWITDAVTNPAQVVSGYGGRRVAHKLIWIDEKEYLLRVVYEDDNEVFTVVTAYITSQIKRYWKEEE